MTDVLSGLLIPFAGTTLGAACVLFVKKEMNVILQRALTGFAAGVMVAASVWSLLLPALSQASGMGRWSFVPAVVGFWAGIMFLFLLDNIIPHLHSDTEQAEGPRANLKKTTMLVLAVTLHNIPEGMAVGVVFAGTLYGNNILSISSALSLSIGIAIQNFPEGAIISLPLYQEGMSKPRSFVMGVLSGVVEPIAAIITIFLVKYISPVLPYVLAFAAGAMIYVVVEELIPEFQANGHSNLATIALAIGFIMMMILDVTLS